MTLIYVEFGTKLDKLVPVYAIDGTDEYYINWGKQHGGFYEDGDYSLKGRTIEVPNYISLVPVIWVAKGYTLKSEIEYKVMDSIADDEDGFGVDTFDKLCTAYSIDDGSEGSVHCNICVDVFPDNPQDYCDHIFYHDSWGTLAGVGQCHDDSDYESHKESFIAFVDFLVCRTEMIQALQTGAWSIMYYNYMLGEQVIELHIGDKTYKDEIETALTDDRDEMLAGYGWLATLEKGTTIKDIERTLEWLK